jgi:hypothetical protein
LIETLFTGLAVFKLFAGTELSIPGGWLSRIILAKTGVLTLSAASTATILKAFGPYLREEYVPCQVVWLSRSTILIPLTQIEVSASFVPESESAAFEVVAGRGFRAGCAGGVMSIFPAA